MKSHLCSSSELFGGSTDQNVARGGILKISNAVKGIKPLQAIFNKTEGMYWAVVR